MGGRGPSNQKPYANVRPAPATSPYMLLDGSTNNGTIDPYTAYVRPAEQQQQQQQSGQDSGRAMQRTDEPDDQPAPYFPPAFLNYGSYYPSYSGGAVSATAALPILHDPCRILT